MESANHQLFVYGSLRSGFNHPAYSYMSNNFTLVDKAKVKGKLYDLGDYPAAVPVNESSYIVGELYLLREDQDFYWVMAQLDDYEGINTEPGEPTLYRREITTVYIKDKPVEAWIYWYNGDVTGRPHIASGDVLEYIKQKK